MVWPTGVQRTLMMQQHTLSASYRVGSTHTAAQVLRGPSTVGDHAPATSPNLLHCIQRCWMLHVRQHNPAKLPR